jgi:hypothetical protein
VYGLPVGHPGDYAEYVDLILSMPRATARLSKVTADGATVAAGGIGPRDLYDLDVDEAEGKRLYQTALMIAASRSAPRG